MKDFLISILILLVLFTYGWFFGEVEEEPQRKQGLVQQPTLVEIQPEESVNTEVGEDTEEIILAPQTYSIFF